MAFSKVDVVLHFYNYAECVCECCSKELVWGNHDKGEKGAWHAHHIKPVKNEIDDSIDNMAILCINNPENCHLNHGHGGNYHEAQPKKNWDCTK